MIVSMRKLEVVLEAADSPEFPGSTYPLEGQVTKERFSF